MSNTIMSQFSQVFKEIGETTLYPVKTLNKAPAKQYKSEVESDHIRIYKISENATFAFAFHNTETDKPYIMTSLKIKENIKAAKYSVSSAKDKIKEFNKILKVLNQTKQLNEKSAVSSFLTIFVEPKHIEDKEEINTLETEAKRIISLVSEKHKLLTNQSTTLSVKILKANDDLKIKYAKKVHELGIPELKKELAKKEELAKQFKSSTKEELKIDLMEKELRKINSETIKGKDALRSEVTKIFTAFPKNYTQKLRDKFNKIIDAL